MEINTALAQIAPEKRFFCFAESSTTDATTSQADLDALASLKQRLIQAGETIHRYQQVDELLAIIEREMRQRLDRAYPPGRKVTPTHYSYHQAAQEIIEEKIRQFVDRVSYLQQLEDFVRDDGRPNYLGIHAVAGTGKSALVANFIKNWTNPDIPIVAHFMTMGGDSQEVNGIMANLGEQLHQLGIIDAALAADPLQLRGELANALHRCGRRLIMIIDALDEIYENGRDLSWLPCSLPPQVRMIITTRPGDSWQRLQRFPYLRELALNALEDREVEQIIEHYNRRDQLELSGSDRELLRQRSAGNPLYLKVALDEISASGIAVGQLALSVQALFAQILQRLQHKYGDELLNRYLGLIAAGRSGLPEKELKEMLGVGDDIVLSLTKALSNFVISRRGLLNFFHPEFERNIMMRIGKRQMRNFHQIQADYFIDKGYAYARALENLPYQLQQGERYEHLLKLLTDLEFLEAKTNAGMVNDLSRDFDFALHSFSVAIPETVTVSHRSGAMVNRSTIQRLGRTLDMNLAFIRRHPQCLLQMMWNYGYWYDAPAAARHYDRTASDDAPWEQQRSEHYRLLENWRECQEGSQEFAWLQAIHPLPETYRFPAIERAARPRSKRLPGGFQPGRQPIGFGRL